MPCFEARKEEKKKCSHAESAYFGVDACPTVWIRRKKVESRAHRALYLSFPLFLCVCYVYVRFSRRDSKSTVLPLVLMPTAENWAFYTRRRYSNVHKRTYTHIHTRKREIACCGSITCCQLFTLKKGTPRFVRCSVDFTFFFLNSLFFFF